MKNQKLNGSFVFVFMVLAFLAVNPFNLVAQDDVKGRVNSMSTDRKNKVLSYAERELLQLGNEWTIQISELKNAPIDTYKITRQPNTNYFNSEYYNKRNGYWVKQTNPPVIWELKSWDKVSNKIVLRVNNTIYSGTYVPSERKVINGTNSLDQQWIANIR